MSEKLQKLKGLLKELFQLDQPDLDFGIYRILHARSAEVTKFLDEELLPQVKQAFSQYRTADKVDLEKELSKWVANVEAAGMNPDDSPKVREMRAKLNDAVDVAGVESEVYDHLINFFRRYYSEGDFLSKRVYKQGVYAIPYEGEEVKLHWANSDQYYIKTSEYLRDYAFRLRPEDEANPMRVHFRLVDATEGEHGNIKATDSKERVFVLAAPGASGRDFVAEENGELIIRFEYRPAVVADWPAGGEKAKPPTQKDLLGHAVGRILGLGIPGLSQWVSELGREQVLSNGDKATRLQIHLNRYTKRNTFDYFIHKDLGGFLRRELDFYIKNEVMHLDDVESESAARAEQYLSKIKVIRRIAGKIIEFVAQLESFQKKLWLKKKFVVETQYCIRLGSIPEEFYPEIASNTSQRDEWVKLYAIDAIKGDLVTPGYSFPLTAEFMKANPTLVVDTVHFPSDFVTRLLDVMGDLDRGTAGVLVRGENFQALQMLNPRFQNACDVVYIDPPYNTDASAIIYKNDYKDSSWLSLVENRTALAWRLMGKDGILCFAIDDEEVAVARQLLGSIFPKEVGIAVVRSNPQSRKTKGKFSPSHEYALFYGKSDEATPGSLEITAKRLARYPKQDEKGRYAWMNFIRTGNNDKRADRPKLYYPIFVAHDDSIRIPKMTWSANDGEYGEYVLHESPGPNEVAVYPLGETSDGEIEKNWHRGHERVTHEPEEYRVRRDGEGRISIDFKTRMDESSAPITWWDNNEYASANYGAAELKELFGTKPFDFPKAITLVQDCIRAAGAAEQSVILDYFAGSGTTGHATINLNREDGGHRRFILVEMGDHFDRVVLPRIKKVTFTPEWKDGKPARTATPEEAERSPGLIKVIRLESYEDALNNLDVNRAEAQQTLFDLPAAQGTDGFKEQYLLRYMLDVETRGSQSLLNIDAFKDPTAYKLKVKRPGSDESREVNVDLLETFNWLIGLAVQHIAAPQSFAAEFEYDAEKRLGLKDRLTSDPAGPWWFRTVTGTTPDGRRTLIIWRKLTGNPEEDNLVLDEWFAKQGYSTKDSEFDLIYVNGGNNLGNLQADGANWKVRLLEEDFHRLMFETEGA